MTPGIPKPADTPKDSRLTGRVTPVKPPVIFTSTKATNQFSALPNALRKGFLEPAAT